MIKTEDQNKILTKYTSGQISPKAYIELVKTQVLGVDSQGKERPFEDLLYFLHFCHKTGLDPVAKQIYAIYRWDTRLGREKMTIQTSIDGLRLVAERTGHYGGQDDIKFTPEDESSKNPTRATATVYKVNEKTGERMAVVATARWNEFVQTKKTKDGKEVFIGMWETMPYHQLGKCAEALALRKAFPNELSGVYTDDEIPVANLDLPKPEPKVETKEQKETVVSVEQDEAVDLEKALFEKRETLKNGN